ncbi:hypothetical protein HOLleu_32241 [Holothuria leucospilota]|uniref:Uncharacterized protein n=1 Tax=Holothuria leucospilota TaxID=206669 RepID=A0A9Q0YRB8_HOLLE|nr:hypothetical protein HOLleu_32241 [Holothuria leucospilota]
MGFSSSYDDVSRNEKNAANGAAPEMLGEETDASKTIVLFAGDNVDHNILTIDGKGTFHGMGMIAAISPRRRTNWTIPRQNISDLNIVKRTKIEIKEHQFASYVHRNIQFRKLPTLCECDKRIDLLWELSFNFN